MGFAPFLGFGQGGAKQQEVVYSPTVLNFEVARNYKLLGDELFLQSSIGTNTSLVEAEDYYLKAKQILENLSKFDSNTFYNSNYLGNRKANELYLLLLQTDIGLSIKIFGE